MRLALAIVLILQTAALSRGSDVTGRAKLPEICALGVLPVVVRLEPVGAGILRTTTAVAANESHFIDQRGLRFEPRVAAMRVGETLRFGNGDPEVHNVHIRGASEVFNQSVVPGGLLEFVPHEPGVYRVVCDLHPHMRAYIVVAGSPWLATCGSQGEFRFRGVPAGQYRLHVWHEMTAPLVRPVTVGEDALDVDVGTLVFEEGPNPITQSDRALVCEKGCEPWPLVLDRISVTLAASLDAAQHPARAAQALPLVQDALYRDFEASGMGTAVRVHLGRQRAERIEDLFRTITATTQEVVAGTAGSASVIGPTRETLLSLSRASEELNRKGVTDWSRIFAERPPAFGRGPGRFGSGQRASSYRGAAAPVPARPVAHLLPALALGAAVLLAALAIPDPARWTSRAQPHRVGGVLLAGSIVLMGLALLLEQAPAGGGQEGPGQPERKTATVPPAKALIPSAAPVRSYPIGQEIERNHLRITALWHRALRVAGSPSLSPEPGAIHLLARVNATEGNPTGFARGDWVPYLTIRYRLTPIAGGPDLTGTLVPLVASDGPRYGANGALTGSEYRLSLHIAPPSEDALHRFADPGDGAAPWWEPFEVHFAGTFRPEPR
jgi:uncharacterized protein involved in high-affinity Fe2+ transport/plastocyanin